MKSKPLFLILLLTAALIPYGILCFYALPFADDFCYGWTASESIPFVQKFLHQYLHWNGRYTADVLVNVHPLISGRLLYYQLALFFSLILTPFSVYVSLLQIFHHRSNLVIASLLFTLFYLCLQPNVTEGVYWYIGIANYHLGNLMFLFQGAFLLFSFSKTGMIRLSLQLIAAILLVGAIGFNEIGAILIPLAYLLIATFAYRQATNNRNTWIVFSLLSVLAALFVFFSPGNFVRSAQFTERFHLFHSLFYAALQTIRFVGKWVLNYPALAISLLLAINAKDILPQLKFKIGWKWLLGFTLLMVFLASFVPYFATGSLGQHRTLNYVFFFFLPLYSLTVMVVSAKFSLSEKLKSIHSKSFHYFLVITVVIALLFSGNGIKMAKDFYQGNFATYNKAFQARAKTIGQDPRAVTTLPVVPEVFRIVDAKSDSAYWVNNCMVNYYAPHQPE